VLRILYKEEKLVNEANERISENVEGLGVKPLVAKEENRQLGADATKQST